MGNSKKDQSATVEDIDLMKNEILESIHRIGIESNLRSLIRRWMKLAVVRAFLVCLQERPCCPRNGNSTIYENWRQFIL